MPAALPADWVAWRRQPASDTAAEEEETQMAKAMKNAVVVAAGIAACLVASMASAWQASKLDHFLAPVAVACDALPPSVTLEWPSALMQPLLRPSEALRLKERLEHWPNSPDDWHYCSCHGQLASHVLFVAAACSRFSIPHANSAREGNEQLARSEDPMSKVLLCHADEQIDVLATLAMHIFQLLPHLPGCRLDSPGLQML